MPSCLLVSGSSTSELVSRGVLVGVRMFAVSPTSRPLTIVIRPGITASRPTALSRFPFKGLRLFALVDTVISNEFPFEARGVRMCYAEAGGGEHFFEEPVRRNNFGR
ncbi:hypothetical protein ABFS83_07G112200 [Erythranthe nasuta]